MYWPKHATRNNTNVLAKAIPKLKEAKKKKNYPSLLVGGVWKSCEKRCSYMKEKDTKGIYSMGPSRFKKIRHTLNT